MKKQILLASLFLFFLVSCQKHYTIEYFKAYQADAPNRLMDMSEDYELTVLVTHQKFSYDIFLVTLYYTNSKSELDTSYGQFNHRGKLLTFQN